MFKDTKLGTKIIAGFLAVVSLVAVAGAAGYWGVEKVGHSLNVVAMEESPIADASMEMALSLSECQMISDELKGNVTTINNLDVDKIEECKKAFEKSEEVFDKLATAIHSGGEVAGVKIIKSSNRDLVEMVKDVAQIHDRQFKPAFLDMVETGKKIVVESKSCDETMVRLENLVTNLIKEGSAMEIKADKNEEQNNGADHDAAPQKNIMAGADSLAGFAMELKTLALQMRIEIEEVAQAQNVKDVEVIEKRLNAYSNEFVALVEALLKGGIINSKKIMAIDDKEILEMIRQMGGVQADFARQAGLYVAKRRNMISLNGMLFEQIAKIDSVGNHLSSVMGKVEEMTGKKMNEVRLDGLDAKHTATVSLVVIVLAAILFGLIIGVLLTKSIVRVMDRMVSGLSEGSVQVASASGQLSSASQGLAQGASEQAASIEETASALEEMSSMTRQNADHAKTANTLAISACNAAEEGDKAMNEMLTAMKSINDSSTRISKIIKVIEEIAFQTNLLALNASVEAARAGDTGKGFAVVADEVRNLAQRASSAAQDTTALIEDSVGRTTKGQELANKSTDTLKNILVNVKKVADLIGEISAATQEQAQGIEQVNTAVGQMDIVTQQNVSNAEETASASEELSAQALNLQDLVRDIVVFVRGASDCMSPDRDVENKSAPQNPEREAVENSRWTNNNKGKHNDENGNNGLNRTGKESNGGSSRNAEELIRLNEDFKGF